MSNVYFLGSPQGDSCFFHYGRFISTVFEGKYVCGDPPMIMIRTRFGWVEYTKNEVVCQVKRPEDMWCFLRPSGGKPDKKLSQWGRATKERAPPSIAVLNIYFGKFVILFKPIKSTKDPF
jgi:hypothetical protein